MTGRSSREKPFMLDWVLQYAAEGFFIHPLQAGSKAPASPHGFKDATDDARILQKIWTQRPDLNIGISCEPSRLLVLDIDGPEARTELEELEQEHGQLPTTRTARTGRDDGGEHRYFKFPEGTPPARSRKLNGCRQLEAKCAGGYIVAPPSLHPTKRRYEWVDSAAEMAIAPPWLLAQLTPRDSYTASDAGPGAVRLDAHGVGTTRTLARLEGLVKTVARATEGQRHNTLFWAAAAAGNMTATGGLDRAYATQALEKAAAQTGLPTSEARRAIADGIARGELSPDPIEEVTTPTSDPFSDLRNAERLVELSNGDLRFDPASKRYVAWDGTVWRVVQDVRVEQLAQEVARLLLREANEAPEGYRDLALRHARKSQNAARLEAMVRVARPTMACDSGEFDGDGWLLNCPSGVVDLKTGDLLDHKRERMMTKIAAAPYDPCATSPRWQSFLERVLPDPDERSFFQRLAGCALIGEVVEQIFVQHLGPGASGKSTALNTIQHVLGDYAAPFDARRLTALGGGQGAEPELVRLRGNRLSIASEPSVRHPLDEGVIKWITGGDRITARGLYQNPVDFEPSHMLWIITNSPLQIQGTDSGIWRRVVVMPWRVSIPVDERDQGLPAKLQEESAGILRWMVEGCIAWQQHGLMVPEPLRREVERYRSSSDLYGQFIADCLVPERGGRVPNSKLRRALAVWSEANADSELSFQRLGQELERRGFASCRSDDERGRRGLRLRPECGTELF